MNIKSRLSKLELDYEARKLAANILMVYPDGSEKLTTPLSDEMCSAPDGTRFISVDGTCDLFCYIWADVGLTI